MPAERHTRMRRMLSGMFTPSRIDTWRPWVRTIIADVFDGLPDGPIDFVTQVAEPYTIRVVSAVIGIPDVARDRVREWSEALMPSATPSHDRQLAAMREVSEYLRGLLTQVRETGGDCILNYLLRAHDEQGGLSEAEVIKNAISMITAGHETTVAVLARGLLRLLEPRSHYKQLVAQPDLTANAIEELLRVESPGDGATLRVATEDVELPSGTVCKGEAVIASTVGPNNDPALHDDPEPLRLDRPNPTHVTFGWGPHYCLGALARMEMQELLAAIVDRFPELVLAEPPDEVQWTTMAVKRPSRLLVRPTPEAQR
jgi:cytochrome P450